MKTTCNRFQLIGGLIWFYVFGGCSVGLVLGSELPKLRKISDEEAAELRRVGDAFMEDFSREKYGDAIRELAKSLGIEESEAENEAVNFERKLLNQNRFGFGGDPIEGKYFFVGSRSTGHREVKLVYLDQRSAVSCPVVIRFLKPDQSWIAQFEVGIVGAEKDLEPFWEANEPSMLAERIPEIPKLLKVTETCMQGIIVGDGREALGGVLDAYGTGWPAELRERIVDLKGREVENPPGSYGKSLGCEILGVRRSRDSNHLPVALPKRRYPQADSSQLFLFPNW